MYSAFLANEEPREISFEHSINNFKLKPIIENPAKLPYRYLLKIFKILNYIRNILHKTNIYKDVLVTPEAYSCQEWRVSKEIPFKC